MTAIFFDVDGTLVRWPEPHRTVLERAVEGELGRARDEWLDHYDDRFFRYFEACDPEAYGLAFADVCERFDLEADPAALADALVQAEFDVVEPAPGAEDLLARLAGRHTLGLLTDGVPRVQFGKVESVGLLEHFDVRVASNDPEVGAQKPDAGIFEAARARVADDRLVLVGDSPEADVAGARRNGFEPVRVDADAETPVVPGFETLAALL